MKRFSKSMQGVTLLEIMLVLAIAAMIIVMSVRYYQSAQASSQANAFVAQVQAIASAAENLAQGAGAFPTSAAIASVVTTNTATVSPWGGTMKYSPSGATGFGITYAGPNAGTCALINAKLAVSTQFSGSTCTANASSTVTYVSTK